MLDKSGTSGNAAIRELSSLLSWKWRGIPNLVYGKMMKVVPPPREKANQQCW
ncbi:MAG: hypothetical protein HY813_00440 [Candidatus Portnoybacteria bacterium]|nr:hypothetical protein [Candidatus Portnoybacteria bacterium]